ncbi:MAG: GrpB family protein [Bacteroidia bacterium]|nr:GrpB family protein [Bacteroidia bacterium]
MKYQESWVNDFNELKQVLDNSILTKDIIIEHIGSTSIKNLAAKPIIDIDIIYRKPETFNEILMGLERLGYYHNGNQGIPGREVFKRHESGNHIILDKITHHLYVCQSNSNELKRHLIFRDYLRENEMERVQYEKLKYKIAEKTRQDRKEYAKLKEVMAKEFIESIIKKSNHTSL